jgi:RHS repeat-associated protein
VATSFEYDSQGNLVRLTRPDGGEDLWTYDHTNADPRTRGLLLRHEVRARAGFPAASRIVWRGVYEPEFQLLRREVDETGEVTRYVYDFDVAPGPGSTGRLREIHRPVAHLPDGTPQAAVLRFESDASDRVTAVVSPTGVRDEYELGVAGNSTGRLSLRRSDALSLALEERYSYDGFGYLRDTVDAAGGVRTLEHDARGRVIRRAAAEISGARAELLAHFDADGRVIGIERPIGAYTDGVLADMRIHDRIERDVLGAPARFVFGGNTATPRVLLQSNDHRGNPCRTVDPEGLVVCFKHDERGLLLAESARYGGTLAAHRRFVYDVAGRAQRLYEGPLENRVTLYEHDAFGRLAKTVLPTGAELRRIWGSGDRLLEEFCEGDAGDGTTRVLWARRYDYDERGRLLRHIEEAFRVDPTAAVDLVTEYYYDADDRLVRVVDPRGGERKLSYDGLGRVRSVEDPVGNVERRSYDDANREIRIRTEEIHTDGIDVREWRKRLDGRGREIEHVESDGVRHRSFFDDRDLPVGEIGFGGVEITRAYGQLGELSSQTTDPLGLGLVNRWGYDRRNAVTAYFDPMDERSDYSYDDLGRPRTAQLPGGLSSSRLYGSDGRVSEEVFGSGTRLRYEHASSGRLTELESTANPNGDALARHEFRYDGLGRLVEARAAGVVVQRVYDSRGRLIAEDRDGIRLEALYDDLAGTLERRWPDGRVEVCATDANGVITSIERTAAGGLGDGPAQLATFEPYGVRHLGAAAFAGGLGMRVRYDQRRRLTDIECRVANQVVEAVKYRYDSASRRRVVHVAGAPEAARYHEFDNRDRLTMLAEDFPAPLLTPASTQSGHDEMVTAFAGAAASAAHRIRFEHDAADSRVKLREDGRPDLGYTYLAGHRLASAGAELFEHHPDGTRKRDGSRRYAVDALGRVTRISTTGGAMQLSLRYDALGRPVTLTDAAGHARELYYFGDELWEEHVDGTLARQFTPHPYVPDALAVHQTGRTHVLLYDGACSLLAAADSAGQIVERYRYGPFGEPTVHAPDGTARPNSTVGLEPRFGAMAYLGPVGLYLARRRLMDPIHGVFLSVDPRGHGDSPNLYVYAVQDPVDLIDPTGELAFLGVLVVMGVGALIGGGLSAARQGIQIAEGSRKEFSWGDLAWSTGLGAVLAPVLVVAPEVAVPLAGMGVANGLGEIADGNVATGSFDIATSLLPFGFKGPRTATFGQGSRFGQWRGLGESASWSTRAGSFQEIGTAAANAAARAWNERFYHGASQQSADAAVADINAHLDMVRVFQRFPGTRHLGEGLYFTRTPGDPSVPGSAAWWAQEGGSTGRGGPGAILEAQIPRWRLALLRRDPGVRIDVPQHNFADAPQSFFPFEPSPGFPQPGPAVQFGSQARWSIFDPNASTPTFSPLWPTLFTPPFRSPDDALGATESAELTLTPQQKTPPEAGGKKQ